MCVCVCVCVCVCMHIHIQKRGWKTWLPMRPRTFRRESMPALRVDDEGFHLAKCVPKSVVESLFPHSIVILLSSKLIVNNKLTILSED